MSVTAQTIIDKAEILLNDTANARWSETTLLGFLNESQRDICVRMNALKKRPAYVQTEIIKLVAGSLQSLDTCNNGNGTDYTPLQILDVDKNIAVTWVSGTAYAANDIVYATATNALYKVSAAHTASNITTDVLNGNLTATSEDRRSNIQKMHEANLDLLLPNWQSANTDDTTTNGIDVVFWMEDTFDELSFKIYPQQPSTSYLMNVEVEYSALPAEVAAIGDNIILNDRYQDAMRDYIVYMAFAIDDEVDEEGNTNSMKWYAKYLANPIFL